MLSSQSDVLAQLPPEKKPGKRTEGKQKEQDGNLLIKQHCIRRCVRFNRVPVRFYGEKFRM